MRWRELSRSSVSCPCGAGRVVTRRLMNEDRHLRKQSWLDCEICITRNMEDWNGGRISLQQQKALLFDVHHQIQLLFQKRYLTEWTAHFTLCGSKKAAWEILRDAGIVRMSISSFYEALRKEPLTCYLNQLPNPDNIHMILTLLEVEDEELLELLQKKYQIEMNLNTL